MRKRLALAPAGTGRCFFGIIRRLKEDLPVKDVMYALTHQCSLLKFVFAADNLKDVKEAWKEEPDAKLFKVEYSIEELKQPSS